MTPTILSFAWKPHLYKRLKYLKKYRKRIVLQNKRHIPKDAYVFIVKRVSPASNGILLVLNHYYTQGIRVNFERILEGCSDDTIRSIIRHGHSILRRSHYLLYYFNKVTFQPFSQKKRWVYQTNIEVFPSKWLPVYHKVAKKRHVDKANEVLEEIHELEEIHKLHEGGETTPSTE